MKGGTTIKNRMESSAIISFVLMMAVFLIANPTVFLDFRVYSSVFTTLPVIMILSLAYMFVIASGQNDLSYPSTVGLCAWMFALVTQGAGSPFWGLLAALAIGLAIGFLNGLLVVRVGLSPLVTTLGMNFLLRGLIMIGTDGFGIPLVSLQDTTFFNIFAGNLGPVPAQMVWGLLWAVAAWLLFNRHLFGTHVCFVGDNATSAREMGINVDKVRMSVYLLMGLAAGFAAILICMTNLTFWPTAGDGYLLIIMASVFLGGTPTWGGVGTIIGTIFGALIMGFLETGIIASGLTGFYTQFFYGLVLILSLMAHRRSGIAGARGR